MDARRDICDKRPIVDGRSVVLIGFTLAAAACTDRKSDGSSEAPACEAYLECLSATDVDLFEEELAVYGKNGSCLEQSDPSTCDEVCRERIEEINSDDEACQPPPEPAGTDSETGTETTAGDPTPDANGQIDCRDVGVGSATVGGGPTGPLGFPEVWCSPRASGSGSHLCCSDDPSAVGGELPSYQGKDIVGSTPIFAGANNSLGTSGMCVDTSAIPAGSGLLEPPAANCPIPCDPTWGEDERATVCGQNRVCCQTRELQPEDCVLDGGTWRPVTGADIPDFTNWAADSHATHQDPGGTGCQTFAGGGPGAESFSDCVAQLRVASQRGFCMSLAAGQVCPAEAPGYLDACTQINMGLIPPPQ